MSNDTGQFCSNRTVDLLTDKLSLKNNEGLFYYLRRCKSQIFPIPRSTSKTANIVRKKLCQCKNVINYLHFITLALSNYSSVCTTALAAYVTCAWGPLESHWEPHLWLLRPGTPASSAVPDMLHG